MFPAAAAAAVVVVVVVVDLGDEARVGIAVGRILGEIVPVS